MFRRTVSKPVSFWGSTTARTLAGASLPAIAVLFSMTASHAQTAQPGAQNKQPTLSEMAIAKKKKEKKGDQKMLVQADELVHDYQNDKVSAVGHVQIYNDGAVLEADRVTYDRKTDRIHAQGNVRYKTKDGKIVYGDVVELTKDFKEGFASSLLIETPQKTRFAAARVDRTQGDTSVFQSGVYTACQPCKDDPSKAPIWQVKAKRIIHKEGERRIYYEDATLEFFGKPIAYFPMFWHPDPSVKRQSGFLIPNFFSSDRIGVGVAIPYFWALAPDRDVTFTMAPMSQQGVLGSLEWRQRFRTGAYTVKATGIYQLDKEQFNELGGPGPGTRDFRGAVETSGQFNINKQWSWGWDGTFATDRTFLNDYNVMSETRVQEKASQLYLVGQGDRSYFDMRALTFMGMALADNNKQQAFVYPVVDYSYIYAKPIFDGQLSFNINVTNLSRQQAEFNAITNAAVDKTVLNRNQCIPGLTSDRTQCIMRGMPGNYSRASYQLDWKRTIINSIGQIFTPFVRLRADVAYIDPDEYGAVSNYVTGTGTQARAMPAVGFTARWPFLAVHDWGTQTIEPIAQVIIRPNETKIGRFPNEDAQSMVFSDANLFAIDKFSGYDRVEGGSRINAGVQYTANFNRFGTVNALFGQSYNIFGKNSYSVADAANTGLQSGLEHDTSDYVARLYYQPNANLAFVTRYLFDKDTFDIDRFEAETKVNWERLTLSTIYARYEAQPLIGFLNRREGVYQTAAYKFRNNWSVNGGVRYDLDSQSVDLYTVGVGFLNECIGISANYTADYTNLYSAHADHRFVFRLVLRQLSSPDIPTGITSAGLTSGTDVLTSLER